MDPQEEKNLYWENLAKERDEAFDFLFQSMLKYEKNENEAREIADDCLYDYLHYMKHIKDKDTK